MNKKILIVLFLVMVCRIGKEETGLQEYFIAHRDNFYDLFNDSSKSLFLVLLKEECQYSDNLQLALESAISRLKLVNSSIKVNLVLYHCKKDEFCKQFFGTKSYPEVRFYNRLIDPMANYVVFDKPREYDIDKLANTIHNHIYPIRTVVDINSIDDDFFSLIYKKSEKKVYKMLYFCSNFHNKKSLAALKSAASIHTDIYLIELTSCLHGIETRDKHINKLLSNDLSHILLVKYNHDESTVFPFTGSYTKLNRFLENNKGQRVFNIFYDKLGSIFSNKETAMILFTNTKHIELVKLFKDFATSIQSKVKMKFLYYVRVPSEIESYTDDDDYESVRFLKRILGVAMIDEPSVRIIKTRSNGFLKYRPEEPDISLKHLKHFYDDFIHGDIENYYKDSDEGSKFEFALESPYISLFDKKTLTKTRKSKKIVFVLVIADEFSCKNCEQIIEEYTGKVGELYEKDREQADKVSFQISNVFKTELDDYIKCQLPALLYYPSKKATKPKCIKYTSFEFEQLFKSLVNNQKPMERSSSVNLSSIEVINEEL